MEKIGQYSSGNVYKIGNIVIKHCLKNFNKQIRILENCQDVPNIIKLLAYDTNNNNIFMEYYPYTLEEIILKKIIDYDTKINILLKLQEFLINFHKKGYVHNDFKCKNIVVNEDLSQIRIIDFDLSTKSKNIEKDYKKFKFIALQLYFNISYEESWRNYEKLVNEINDFYFLNFIYNKCQSL